MLTGKKLTISAKSVIDDVEIATFGAVLSIEDNDLSLYSRPIDKDACKEHREIVRVDQAAFEDFAYGVQDQLKGTK